MTNRDRLIRVLALMNIPIPKEMEYIEQMADLIIKEFPQIEAEKIWEGKFDAGVFLQLPPVSAIRDKQYRAFIMEIE